MECLLGFVKDLVLLIFVKGDQDSLENAIKHCMSSIRVGAMPFSSITFCIWFHGI